MIVLYKYIDCISSHKRKLAASKFIKFAFSKYNYTPIFSDIAAMGFFMNCIKN